MIDWRLVFINPIVLTGKLICFPPLHPIGEIHPAANASLIHQRRQDQRKFSSNYHAKSNALADIC